jgi:hypothetical protein
MGGFLPRRPSRAHHGLAEAMIVAPCLERMLCHSYCNSGILLPECDDGHRLMFSAIKCPK